MFLSKTHFLVIEGTHNMAVKFEKKPQMSFLHNAELPYTRQVTRATHHVKAYPEIK